MEVTLAVDYGLARVGTALSAGWMARPLEVIPLAAGEAALIERLLRLADQERATRWLVGLPVNADGTEGEQAGLARAFAARLAAHTPLPVYLWDEYGSSQAAMQRMIESGRRRRSRRAMVDAVAAALFLQEFVDQGGTGGELVPPSEQECDE